MAQQPARSPTTAAGFASAFEAVTARVATVVEGNESAVRLALVCLLAEGHLLIEDVPGVGKTTLAKALARALDLGWHRIQFTPDLLPSDLTGAMVFHRDTSALHFRPGGVFANIVVGDEINRASPRTQSALLEAMEERQVTVDATTRRLPHPFMVIATQNPADHAGTYPLPDSQLDRFLFRVRLGYPSRAEEIALLDSHDERLAAEVLQPVIGPPLVLTMIEQARRVHVSPALRGYIVDLARASRSHPGVALGMSPRASLSLQRAARVLAATAGRDYAIPDDVKELLPAVLDHRLTLTPDERLRGTDPSEVSGQILESVPIPAGRRG